ncbi:F-box domain protein [Pandoravirus inopinatum]|uniref:F-box domain protein n=1 Tax=Pandoravirus inopinatum TaxID=1605721 RepID=A0A0B5IYA1_9VIRU|nr:F-box domain protein [Pandoravirus inopinatum]AJF97823.1 F-box domain protein [Pandoravirus inopinatum]
MASTTARAATSVACCSAASACTADCATRANGPTLADLPAEIMLYMLSYLTTRDVGACAMTVRALATACDDHALWTRLHKQERTGEKARWQAGVRSMVAPIMMCSVWSKYQIKNGQNTPAYITNRIVQDIHDMIGSPWHSSIDLTALLGHPRFACAARTNVRVIMDSSFDAAPHARGLSSCAEDYVAVGTIVRCTSIGYGHGSRITIQRGFFDADGVLCGPGLTHTQRRGREACMLWHGCAGSWTGGRATMPDADALYDGGYRYRGGLADGLCHGRGRAFDREAPSSRPANGTGASLRVRARGAAPSTSRRSWAMLSLSTGPPQAQSPTLHMDAW